MFGFLVTKGALLCPYETYTVYRRLRCRHGTQSTKSLQAHNLVPRALRVARPMTFRRELLTRRALGTRLCRLMQLESWKNLHESWKSVPEKEYEPCSCITSVFQPELKSCIHVCKCTVWDPGFYMVFVTQFWCPLFSGTTVPSSSSSSQPQQQTLKSNVVTVHFNGAKIIPPVHIMTSNWQEVCLECAVNSQ